MQIAIDIDVFVTVGASLRARRRIYIVAYALVVGRIAIALYTSIVRILLPSLRVGPEDRHDTS